MTAPLISGQVVGAEAVAVRLRVTLPERARVAARNEVRLLGLTLERKVKLEKLQGQVLHRRSGRLVRSINTRFRDTPTSFTASTGTNLSYGRAWELGFHGTVNVRGFTRRNGSAVRPHTRVMNMNARPFLRPTLDEMRPMIRDRLLLAMKGGGWRSAGGL